jgi:hypothetical protein
VDGEQVGTSRVNASKNKCCTNLTLMPSSGLRQGESTSKSDMTSLLEKHLFQHCHGGDNSGLSARGKGVQLHIGRNETGGKFGVGCSPCAATANGLRDIMNLEKQACKRWTARVTLLLTFSQFLSATMGPSVARVSAPRITPSLNRQPTMVVPVLVATGCTIPFSARCLFLILPFSIVLIRKVNTTTYRVSFAKSNPERE